MFRQIIEHINSLKGGGRVVTLASAPGGNPVGAPPGSRTAWMGGGGFEGRGVTRDIDVVDVSTKQYVPPPMRTPIIFPDKRGESIDITRTNDALWWDSARPAQDLYGIRHTRHAIDSYASSRAWGSSDVASGPEGTKVLFPPRIPRALATPRAVQGAKAGNVLLNYANDHIQTPNVPVVAG